MWPVVALIGVGFTAMIVAAKILPPDDPTLGRITTYTSIMLTGLVTYLGIKYSVDSLKSKVDEKIDQVKNKVDQVRNEARNRDPEDDRSYDEEEAE